MALWRKKPVNPASFEAILIDGKYYYAGPTGAPSAVPKEAFEAENELVPLERAG